VPPSSKRGLRRLPQSSSKGGLQGTHPENRGSLQGPRRPRQKWLLGGLTESKFFGNEYVTNAANFGEEVTEDAEERLTASVHETSHPDETTDLIVNASAGRGPLPPGDVMSLLSDKTDRRSPVRTPERQEQTSASKPKGGIEKLTQQLNVFGKKKEGKRKGNMHLTNPFTDPGYAVSSHSRANKYWED